MRKEDAAKGTARKLSKLDRREEGWREGRDARCEMRDANCEMLR